MVNNQVSELSIFFPFWNEEENIEKVVKNAIPIAEEVSKKWEIIMVDDGSSDKTLSIAQKLAKQDPRLKAVSHQQNRGYGAALKEGFDHARYNIVVFADGDGQFDFSQIHRFIEKIDQTDIVIGYRKKRKDHPFRHILMNLLKIWDFVFFGFYFRDIDCGFKMFKKKSLQVLMPFKSEGAMITTEILAKAKKRNLHIAQVEVSHYPRESGDQSGGNMRVIIRAVKESLLLWKELQYGKP